MGFPVRTAATAAGFSTGVFRPPTSLAQLFHKTYSSLQKCHNRKPIVFFFFIMSGKVVIQGSLTLASFKDRKGCDKEISLSGLLDAIVRLV